MNALALRALRAQTRIEILLALRRFENLLVTLVVPVLLLVFFVVVPVLPTTSGDVRAIDRLAPSVLAASVMATGLVALGISTAFERASGVLKRLAGSPLPRWALLAAKTISVGLTVLAQLVVVAVVGALLGWSPQGGLIGGLAAALPWLLIGLVCFSALGLLLAGTLRPEAVLAVANALFLVSLLLGGVIVPLGQLPGILATPASLLPPALLAELLRGTLVPGASVDPLQAAGLGAWTVGLAVAAIATFRTT